MTARGIRLLLLVVAVALGLTVATDGFQPLPAHAQSLTLIFSETEVEVEEGGAESYSVVLSSRPSSNLTVTLGGVGGTDLSLSRNSLTFTRQNWSTPKSVSVTADQDDDAVDDTATITHTSRLGTDSVTVTIIDDETQGVTTIPSYQIVYEGGAPLHFEVVLDSQPTANVTYTAWAPNSDGQFEQLHFTPRNWDTPQTLTITGGEDTNTVDEVGTRAGTVAGGDYDGVKVRPVDLQFLDNDPVMGYSLLEVQPIEEDAGTVSFGIKAVTNELGTPSIDYAVRVETRDGTAESGRDYVGRDETLWFEVDDFSRFVDSLGRTRYRQTVYFDVYINNDIDVENSETFELYLNTHTGYERPVYNVRSIDVTINDDDPAGVTVRPKELSIDEGGSKYYTVLLDGRPSKNVRVTLDSTSNTDVTTNLPAFSFTPNNWNVPRRVTVSAAEDGDAVDDTATITHTLSSAIDDYNGIPIDDVTVTVTDDDPQMDIALVELQPVDEDVGTVTVEVVATTTEAGVPSEDYSLRVRSSDDSAGSPGDYQAVDETLEFAATDFSAFVNANGDTRYRQSVHFNVGINDDSYDEDAETFLLSLLEIPGYEGHVYSVPEIEVTILDDDTAGVTVTPTGLTIIEGTTATYTVVLDSTPTRRKTTVTISNPANTEITAEPTSLEFTPNNWNVPQRVTVTAEQDDDVFDETVATITHTVNSASDQYDGIGADSVTVTVTDDDTAGVTISETSLTIEEGVTSSYTVVLDTVPAGDVTVTAGGIAGTDLTLGTTTLTFSTSDWNVPQTVTVTAAQDDDAIDEATTMIVHTVASVADGDYQDLPADDVAVTITDDDTAGVTFSESSLTIGEGGTSSYSVVLDTRPAGDVTVTVGGIAGTDLTLDETELTFTDLDWDVAQTVTVTAEQDADIDNDVMTLTHTVASVADGDYDGLSTGSIAITVTDDDAPSVAVSFEEGSYTVAEGSSVPVRVTLSGDPLRPVDIPLTIEEQGGATLDDYDIYPTYLTFNAGETEKDFTFTAVQDTVDDDDEGVKVGLGNTLPAGMFAGSANETVFSITDDDVPSVTVSFGQAGYSVLEGTPVTITIRLSADPERTVIVPLTAANRGGATSDDYSGVPASLTFNSGETERTFELTTIEDAVDDTGEWVILGFGTLPPRVSEGTPDEARVYFSDTRATHMRRVNPDLSVNHNATVAGLFMMRIHFVPPASELAMDDLEIIGGIPQEIFNSPIGGTNVWYVTILPDQGAVSVTVRVPRDVVEGGNPAAELTYDAVPPLTAVFTTGATEPVVAPFELTITFSHNVTIVPFSTEGTAEGYFSPGEDLVITHGAFVDYQKVTNKVWNITVSPDIDPGTTTVTLPHRSVATGYNFDFWNQESGMEIEAGRRSAAFRQAAYTVDEGAGVTVTVTLDADPLNTVVIPLTATVHGGATSTDFSGVPTDLTFNSGETVKTFTFSATDDSIDDDGESVTIGIGTPLPGIIRQGITFETSVRIMDDDVAGISISETALEIAEGASGNYTVVLDTLPAGDVKVILGGHSGTDLSLGTTTLTFTDLDWDAAQSVTVTAGQDDDAVDDTATLTHSVRSTDDSDYDGVPIDSVDVTVRDDDPQMDVALVEIQPVDEDVGTVRVEVVATTTESGVPSDDYAVRVRSSDDTAGSPGDYQAVDETLEFRASDFVAFVNANGDTRYRQSVYFDVAINDNSLDEDEETFLLSLQEIPGYEGHVYSVPETEVTILDDDTAGVTVTPVELTIGEGATSSYTVVLDTRPSRRVTVTIGDPSNTDVTVSPGQLRFAARNWDDPQTVTVTAARDHDAVDDDATITHTVTSASDQYDGLPTDDVTVTVTDVDIAGVTISETALEIEEGATGTYTVVLTSEPAGDVRVTVGGITGTDLSLDETELTFTDRDWSVEQTVTVTAANDFDAVDDTATLTHTVSSAADSAYDGLPAGSVAVRITDDDTVGVTVSETSLTIEEGGSDTYTVVLTSQPTSEVIVTIGGHSGTDVRLSGQTLTGDDLNFTPGNWNSAQTVTVKAGEDDDAVDESGVTLSHSVTGASEYASLAAVPSVLVTINDDDTAGVSISVTSLDIGEGATSSYTVVLTSEPAGDVRVIIGGHSGTDVTVDTTTLTFTDGNWNDPQTVTVTAAQDHDAVDDAATLTHTVSSTDDAIYNNLPRIDVAVTIDDDDIAGVSISKTSLDIGEGATSSYTVVLTSQPTGDVRVIVGGHSGTDVRLDTTTLTFTGGNWNDPQTVTVTAAQDHDAVDDAATLTHTVSSTDDAIYNNLPRVDVAVTIDDDDTAGVSISKTSLDIDEGATSSYTVVLDTEPTSVVTVTIGGHSGTDVRLSGQTLTGDELDFTPGNWNDPQTVTVTAAQDDDATHESGVTLSHAVTGASEYAAIAAAVPSVSVTITDDDTAGVTVSETSLTIEEGDSGTYTVVLTSEPSAEVTVTIGGHSGTDVSLDETELTFTPGNWSTAQAVTVTAGQDDDAVDEQVVTITHSVGSTDDTDYDGLPADSVDVSITENDSVGVTVSETSLTITEGDSGDYTVALDSEPTGDVTVTVGGYSGTDVSLDETELTFTPGNWSTAQTVTVTVVEDDDAVDEQVVTITHTVGSTDDTDYDGLPAGSVAVTVTDDDGPGVSVSFGQGAYSVDEGDTLHVTLTLSADPERTVEIPISTKSLGETTSTDYSVVPTTLTFNSGDTSRTLAFTATADNLDDDGESVRLGFEDLPPGVSAGSTAETVVSIDDDDTAGVTISVTSLTIEEGDSDTYTVVLTSEPTFEVTVTIGGHSGTDLSLDTTGLTFTDGNWNVPQRVTVNAGEDDDAVDEQAVTITHTVASVDTAYDGLPAGGVAVRITENDSAGVTVSESSLTIEEGDSGTYTVVLTSEPTSEVTVTIGGHSGTDVSLDETELTFTGLNWDVPQRVTVTAEQDHDAVDEQAVTITHSVGSTGDTDYDGLPADSVDVRITENDSVGVTISESSLTIEEGDSGAYTVALDTQPSADVTVTISGHSGTDVSLSGQTLTGDELTFTPGNWSTAQTVTVTAVEDDDAVDEQAVTITHTVGSTDDTAYDGLPAGNVDVTVTDDDTAGVTVSETSLTIEEGDSDTYTVVLDSEPAGEVTVTVGGYSGADLSLDTTELTFTDRDWDVPQRVTVTAEQDHDAVDDDAELTHTVSSTEDSTYDNLPADKVTVRITDDDSAGVTISKNSLNIGEGRSDTYTVVLDSQPTAVVTVTIGGHSGTDVSLSGPTLSGNELTFTPGNWDSAQTVTVNAGEDDDAVDESGVTLSHSVTGASEYAAITVVPSVAVTISDDDTVGVTVSETSLTIEEGDSATYTVVLTSEPAGEVKVTVGGHSGTDVSLDETELTFTDGNWNDPQTVTVTAAQDHDAVDDTATLTHTVSSTGDTDYDGLPAAAVDVRITENDSVGVTISESSLTIEEGDSGAYTVALDTQPSAEVTVTIGGHSGTDVSLDETELTFTPGNWSTAQAVTVNAGEDDDAVDESGVTLSHSVTGASEYAAIAAVPSVSVTITDDDSAGVTISETSLSIGEGGSETYTVVLDTEPSAEVTVTISGHAGTDVSLTGQTLTSGELTFTPGNWSTAQTVTVTAGEDDDAASESEVILSHAVTGASEYAAIAAAAVPSVPVTITEDDSAGVTIDPTALTVREGHSNTYTVVLTSEPTSEVTVTIGGITGTDVSLDETELTFTDRSWNVPQTVTVTAVEDDDAVDEQVVTITHTVGSTDDTDYDGLPAAGVDVRITDDDTVGVTISESSLTITEGDSGDYTVVLDSEPAGDVTVTVGGYSGTDVSLDETELTFTDGNWNVPQRVTVTAVEDDDAVDEQVVTITHTVSSTDDTDYDGLPAAAVDVRITENDSAGVTISESSLTIEEGDSDTYTVVLTSEPAGEVTVTIGGHSGTDVSLDETELTFTDGNWNVPQRVTVTTVEDDDAVDEQVVTITHTVSSTDDTNYDGLPAAAVDVRIIENDTVGVTVSESSLTIEEGGSDTYTVVLTSEPAGEVKVTVGGHSGADLSLDRSELTFTDGNWNGPQTVRVTAAQDHDAVDDAATLTHTVSSTGDTDYDSLPRVDVAVTIDDDDSAGATVSQTSLTITEGDSGAYTVALDAEPAGEVTVTIGGHSGTDVSLTGQTLTGDELTFTPGNWSTAQTVTVNAGEDADAVDDTATLTHTVSSTGDSDYDSLPAAGVDVRITDDDSAGVTISESSLTIAEGGSGAYTVALDTEPTAEVTVTIGGHSGTDVSLSGQTLTSDELDFTPGNWNDPQTVTVTAAQDDDATHESGVTLSHAVTGASEYAAIAAAVPSVSVTITDDDTAGVTVSETSLTIEEGDSGTYTVVLTSEPSAEVTVTIGGHSGTDVSLDETELTFTPGNWSTAQTVTATAGQDDDAVDDTATLTHTVSSTGDSDYDGLPADSVDVRITENDSVGVTVSETSLTITEGDSGDYTVVLDSEPAGDVTVTVGGYSGTDVSLDTTELTFTDRSWSVPQTVTVTAEQDHDAVDDTATLTHTVGSADDTAYNGVPAGSVTVTVTDDDGPGVSVSFGQGAYSVDEGDTLHVTVTLSADPERTVEIPISTESLGETTSSDYSVVPTTLIFNSGETEKTLTFSAVQDNLDDDGESVKLGFERLPSGVSAGNPSETTVSITNVGSQISLEINFESPSYVLTEGATTLVTVTLNAPPGSDVNVPISTESLGETTSSDYSVVPTTLTFNSNDTSRTLAFTATADNLDDDGESVKLGFEDLPPGVSAGGTAETVVSIDDDDTAGVTISETSLIIGEGRSDTYTVVLTSEPAGEVKVTVGGHSGADLSLDTTELTFSDGNWNSPQTVTVTAGQDDDAVVDEAELTHTVSSTDDSGYDNLPGGSVTVTVTDDDTAGVTISESALTIGEGGSDTYTVVLTSEPAGDVKVTVGGHSGTDLSLDKTELNFTTGNWNSPQTVTVTADQDHDAVNDTATLTHTVSSTDDTYYDGLPQVDVAVTISDDDSAGVGQISVQVSFKASMYELREGSTIEITVILSDDPERVVTIPLSTTNGSGATSDDYSGVPGSVSFAVGITEHSFEFTAVQDEEDEHAEDLILRFDTLPPGVSAGTPVETTVTIIDSLRVSFEASRYEAYEGGTGADVTVHLDSAVAQETIIPITAIGANGATDDDWTGVPETLTFASGERSDSFTLMAYDDTVEDNGEMVVLGFGTLPQGVVPTSPSSATVELMNTEIIGTRAGCDNRANKVIVLDRVASIGAQDETNVWTVPLDPYRLYIFELIGANHGSDILGEITYSGTLTLEEPNFIHILNSSGSGAISHRGTRQFVGGTTGTGPFEIKVGSGDGGTGRYQIKVRVNNICFFANGVAVYKYDGGPDGYPLKFDEAPGTSTDDSLYRISYEGEHFGGSGFLGNHGGTGPDVDWFRVELHSDYEYQVEVWTGTSYPEKHQATDLKILGIHEESGVLIGGTTSPTSGKSVSVDFQPTTTGRYHISVGSEGNDHTGVYQIRVTGLLMSGKVEPARTLPTEPLNLRAEVDDDGFVSLTWDAPADDSVESYQILRHRPDEGESTPMIYVEDTGSEETTFIDVRVSAGIRYVYSVKAINYVGNYVGVGPKSNEAEVTLPTSAQASDTASNTPATGAPAISGTALAGETLTADVSRIEDEDGMTSATFIYQWIRTAGGTDEEITDAVNSTYMVTDEDVGNPIKVRVTFTDDAGNEESLTSFGVIATRLLQVPGSPGTPDVSPRGSGSLAVSWTAPDTDGGSPITGYRVQWKEAQDSWAAAGDVSEETVTGTSHTTSGLADGTEYSIRVLAINDVGESVPSAVGSATTLEAAPPDLSGASVDGATLTLTFEEALDGSSAPATAAFTVTVGGSSRGVESVTVSSSSVTLILASAVTSQDLVVVSYTAPADEEAESLRGAEGTAVESFTDRSVTNETASTAVVNSPAIGQPSISGTAQVGETLTADTSVITDADGLINASYSYQWLADDGNSVTEIAGATGSSYTLTADDEGAAVKVRVSFTDDAGNEESLTSAATEPVSYAVQQQKANSPAIGQPTISGTAQVGERLTADTSGIADADGLTNASFNYQWLADDGNSVTEIAGATGSSYTVQSDDAGSTIQVKVSFTDDAGNEESLTSAATAAVVVAEAAEPPTTPTGLTAAASHDHVVLSWDDPQDDTITGYVILRRNRATTAVGHFTELVSDTGSAATTFTDHDVEADASYTYKIRAINEQGVSERSRWARADTPAPAPANSPATGAPTISGTAQVGETLTVNTSSIVDSDGLTNVSYGYQWLADGTDVTGATATTYTLTDSEEGKTIKVRVSFTDDAGNGESLTSSPTAMVEARPNSPATGQPTISGTAQVGETLNASTSGIADSDGLTNVSYGYQWLADGTDVTGATATTYTLTDIEEGKTIQVKVSFTDDAGNEEESTSAATDTVDARPNSPATGQPTISGTVLVGETLTVSTSGIADADGLSSVTYRHQWLADGADITGATDSTYTLAATDAGAAVKVRVSFTDDGGNEEESTSAATNPVAVPLTGSFHDAPDSHDGSSPFTFELRFSEELKLSYKKLKNHAFTVTGGTVQKAQRIEKPSNIRWRITVVPDSDSPVHVLLPATTRCGSQGGICASGGRKFSSRLELTVAGPGE